MSAYTASSWTGSPHSSHSVIVRGRLSSRIVVRQSTNGTSATMARNRSGRRFATAPISKPPALPPRAVSRSGAVASLVHEVLRARDEVGERVRLVQQLAVVVPTATHLAAAAHVRDREHDTAVEQADARRRKRRDRWRSRRSRSRRAASARGVAVEIAAVHDRDRDARAVAGDGPLPPALVLLALVAGHRLAFHERGRARAGVVVVRRRRRDEGGVHGADRGALVHGIAAQPRGVHGLRHLGHVVVGDGAVGGERHHAEPFQGLGALRDHEEPLEGVDVVDAHVVAVGEQGRPVRAAGHGDRSRHRARSSRRRRRW